MVFRTEKDSLGFVDVPIQALYGGQTQRALMNFNVTDSILGNFSQLVDSLVMIKMAAAKANYDLGLLPEDKSKVIVESCETVLSGKYYDQFVIDMIQGGAGTSSNMNANEVIANMALVKMGYAKGDYHHLHPNDHVNCSQSTNDVYPTAARLSILLSINFLTSTLNNLVVSLNAKAKEFQHIIKVGRTQLQDAVPMTLGQEFEAFAATIYEEITYINAFKSQLYKVNLGGTAIGTGINTLPQYGALVIAYLSEISDEPLEQSTNLIEATSDTSVFVSFSALLKRLALKMGKIANDLRLLSSGPRTGFNEINLPAMQPGSSIMPGKVNPVIPEMVNQVSFQIVGHDVATTLAADAGQLQLNAMEPLIIFNILNGLKMITQACEALDKHCVQGITANEDQCQFLLQQSICSVTALAPHIGYANASRIAQQALLTGVTVKYLVLEENFMDEDTFNRLTDPQVLMHQAPIDTNNQNMMRAVG